MFADLCSAIEPFALLYSASLSSRALSASMFIFMIITSSHSHVQGRGVAERNYRKLIDASDANFEIASDKDSVTVQIVYGLRFVAMSR